MYKLQFLKEQFRFSLLNHMMDYYFDCYISPSAKIEIISSTDTDEVSTIIDFDDATKLCRWLDWLDNDGLFNPYEDEEDV